MQTNSLEIHILTEKTNLNADGINNLHLFMCILQDFKEFFMRLFSMSSIDYI